MNDELPEPLNRLPRPAAPRELHQRTLAAVDRELAVRRKPRWERVLELSVAAVLVLGVGLNANVLSSSIRKFATGGQPEFTDVERGAMIAHDDEPAEATGESFEASYARYLAQLSAKTAD